MLRVSAQHCFCKSSFSDNGILFSLSKCGRKRQKESGRRKGEGRKEKEEKESWEQGEEKGGRARVNGRGRCPCVESKCPGREEGRGRKDTGRGRCHICSQNSDHSHSHILGLLSGTGSSYFLPLQRAENKKIEEGERDRREREGEEENRGKRRETGKRRD
jgi:hypothetical protein